MAPLQRLERRLGIGDHRGSHLPICDHFMQDEPVRLIVVDDQHPQADQRFNRAARRRRHGLAS